MVQEARQLDTSQAFGGVSVEPIRWARNPASPVMASVSFVNERVELGGDAPGDGTEVSVQRLVVANLRALTAEGDAADAVDARARGDADGSAFSAALQDPVRVASATLTAGFVWWLTRGGGLLTSVLMGVPAWRHVDLLPVLGPSRGDGDDEDIGPGNHDGGEAVDFHLDGPDMPDMPDTPELGSDGVEALFASRRFSDSRMAP
jgi:hypothetical protein